MLNVAVVGAGWAGCAAAVRLVHRGHAVTVFEAARVPGGRARALAIQPGVAGWPDELTLDNGQHILIGAYVRTLELMRDVGLRPEELLLRLPLALVRPDGSGIDLPDWPAPLDAAWGIARARGWGWAQRASLLRVAWRWRRMGFECPADWTVQYLCHGLHPQVMAELIEPLTISALNTPVGEASARVLLRVLRDALFGASRGSNLLLPRRDLGALLPDAALRVVAEQGGNVCLGHRVQALAAEAGRWRIEEQVFDHVLLACPAWEAARLAGGCDAGGSVNQAANQTADWAATAQVLQHEAIATVYVHAPGLRLARAMLALASDAARPAQFVFDRGQLGGPPGLLAFVVSASRAERDELQRLVLAQALATWPGQRFDAIQTVVEKRATFACTPGLRRPTMQVATLPGQPGGRLLACADYVEGPYPATLEGAVRSGLDAADALG